MARLRMNGITYISSVLITCLVVGLGVSHIFGQDADWKRQVSPDKLFSVELPAPLKQVPIFEAEIGVYHPEEKPFLDTIYLVADEAELEKPRFAVIVFGPKTVREMRRVSRKEREDPDEVLERLAMFHMTDDDSGTELRKRPFIVNGTLGTEFTYEKRSQSTLFSRGFSIERSRRIYLLVYVGKDSADLFSATADRFFNSFKVLQSRQR